MKKPDRARQRRERRETNESNRVRNRAVGVLNVAGVEALPEICRHVEIIEARPMSRPESLARRLVKMLFRFK